MKQQILPPLAAVQIYTKRYPNIWDKTERLLERAKENPPIEWDRSICMCPIAAANTIASTYTDSCYDPPIPSLLAALYAWRKEKLIYTFDADITEELLNTADDIVVPVEILEHLPAKCVYIPFSEFLKQPGADGFFAFIEHDPNTKAKELRINPIDENGNEGTHFSLHLSPGATIGQGMEESAKYAFEQYEKIKKLYPGKEPDIALKEFLDEQKAATPFIEFCVQLLLYICADNADIEENPKQKSIYRPTSRIRDQFKEVRQWDVGVKIGASLRKAKSQSAQSHSDMPPLTRQYKNRPHIRRAHWHHFWTGSRDNPKLILRWVSSIVVNAEDGDIIPTIIEEKGEPK